MKKRIKCLQDTISKDQLSHQKDIKKKDDMLEEWNERYENLKMSNNEKRAFLTEEKMIELIRRRMEGLNLENQKVISEYKLEGDKLLKRISILEDKAIYNK